MTLGRMVFYVPSAVGLAVLTNVASAKWAERPTFASPWLYITLALSPLAFLSFGLVASIAGLATAAALIDATLLIATVAVGLTGFHEWRALSTAQLLGLSLAIAGIGLLTLSSKA